MSEIILKFEKCRDFIPTLSEELKLNARFVGSAVQLLKEGNNVPCICSLPQRNDRQSSPPVGKFPSTRHYERRTKSMS